MINDKPVGVMYHYETCFVFHLFSEYWHTNDENEFKHLQCIWKKNKWSLFELYVICEKIDDRDELFNPNLIFGKQLFYIEHVKTCLLLDF